MQTDHQVVFGDAAQMGAIDDGSVDLVVTSPPYPMIEMWDEAFVALNPDIGEHLRAGRAWDAFESMHAVLDRTWREVDRVLVDGGIACINIGDATRTLEQRFALYPNHARILSSLVAIGLTPLPAILWRKPTNAPNKFMGSGTLPPGAYVTLEHEYILVVRKGDKRAFAREEQKSERRASAFFWEERNQWFSDVWFDVRGTGQKLVDKESRDRSASYPFELPYRLIQMFSVRGDKILDPFLGAGTTMFAAMASARDSVGYELDSKLGPTIEAGLSDLVPLANERVDQRLQAHREFVQERESAKGPLAHTNEHYGFPVVTRQERELRISKLVSVDRKSSGVFTAHHD